MNTGLSVPQAEQGAAPRAGTEHCSVAVLALPALLKIAKMLFKTPKVCWVCFSFPFQSMPQGITQVTSTIYRQK